MSIFRRQHHMERKPSQGATERIEYEALERKLRKELGPHTALPDLLFRDVVGCAWRMKLSMRGEQMSVKEELKAENEANRKASLEDTSRMEYPYPLTAVEIRPCLKLLERI